MVHGVVTLVIAAISAYLVFGVWYPDQLAVFIGGEGLFLLIITVEICLGPLMSLIIYTPAKQRKEIIKDYVVIAILQIAALIYGLHTTFISRPVYAVFVVDRIEIISAVELSKTDLSMAAKEFRRLPKLGIKRICVERPKNVIERSDILMSAITTNKDIELMPKYYRQCAQSEILNAALNGDLLVEKLKLKDQDEALHSLPEDFKWLPVKSRFGSWIEIYPERNLKAIKYLNVDPFLL